LAGVIFDTSLKRLAFMDFPGTQAMFENLFRFVDHSIRERDLLINALDADKRDDDYQAKLKAFNNGTVSGHAPIGRTIRLISDINLPFGFGERDKAYQAATAEAIWSGLGLPLLPKLEAANSAHRELCSQTMELADRLRLFRSLPVLLDVGVRKLKNDSRHLGLALGRRNLPFHSQCSQPLPSFLVLI
jgi:hypothetical protein